MASTEQLTYTIDSAIDSFGVGKYQYLVFTIASLGFFADATEMLLLSFLGPSIRCEDWNVGPNQEALLSTVVFLGMMFGSVFWGVLSDRKGRRYSLLRSSAWVAFVGILTGFVQNYISLLAIRFCVGIGLGGITVCYSMLMEVLPSSVRGRYGCYVSLFWTFGTVVTAFMASIILPSLGWRVLVWQASIPSILVAVLVFNMDESIRFLAGRNQKSECEEIIHRIALTNGKSLPEGSLDISKVVEDSAHIPIKNIVGEIFSKDYLWDSSLLFCIWFINAFSYYGVVLFTTEVQVLNAEEEGIDTCGGDDLLLLPKKFFWNILVDGFAEFPATLLIGLFVDSIGRRKSHVISFATVSIAFFFMLFFDDSNILLFFARGAAQAAFAVTFIVTPEMYRTKIRTSATGIANAFARLGGMICPFVAESLVRNGYKSAAVLIFSVLSGIAVLCAVGITRETTGTELDSVMKSEIGMKTFSKKSTRDLGMNNGGSSNGRNGRFQTLEEAGDDTEVEGEFDGLVA